MKSMGTGIRRKSSSNLGGEVVLGGEWTSQARVKLIRNGVSGTWLRMIMREGRKPKPKPSSGER